MNAAWLVEGLVGGALLGVATSVLLVVEGISEGVSGMAGRVFSGEVGERRTRLAFLLGLAMTGLACSIARPQAFATISPRPLAVIFTAGLLVGFGARLANGCTSGHGIYGVSRAAHRSMVATAIFCAVAALVVALYPIGGGS